MTNQPYLIGICGGSGSGKTSFIKAIGEAFSPEQVCILSQDNYYLPREAQYVDAQGEKNFDLPKSFDRKALLHDIQLLKSGQTVTRKEYTFNNPEAIPQMLHFPAAPIVIIEGLFLFHYKKIAPLFDLKVFIFAKDNLKVIRRIKRDRVERNYPLEDVLYKYEHHVLPSYEKYILPYKDDADVVVNNNGDFNKGLAVLAGFIERKLAGAGEETVS
jgi:uridine kinase